MGLEFYPLYWVYHDCWDYTESSFERTYYGTKTHKSTYHHFGHIHFFIPQIDIFNTNTQKAYTGQQTYEFKLNELWGPNSNDINQQQNFKVIGSPKWYFYIEQYWRRIYIQNWDYKTNNNNTNSFLGKKGIKYDASLKNHTKGVFRQTKDNYFFYTQLCRTLPIQYWRNSDKTIRDHYLRLNNRTEQYNYVYNYYGKNSWKYNYNNILNPTWDFSNDYPKLINDQILPKYDPDNGYVDYTDFYTHYDQFTIPRGKIANGDPNYDASLIKDNELDKKYFYRTYCDQFGARVSTPPDRYYIHPTIQYQKVIQKNWQRLQGWEDRDIQNQQTGFVFGDGYNQTIKIPYQINFNGKNITMSPFSDDNGKVYGAGIYQHNVVKQQDKLKKNITIQENGRLVFNNYQLQLLYNKPRTTWSQPMSQQTLGYNIQTKSLNLQFKYPSLYQPYLDGMWVQQCLGAIVKAKVKVITQDQYGGRKTNWIQLNSIEFQDPFVGKQVID